MGKTDSDERPKPDFRLEAGHLAAGARWVAGVDEAGRGPLAGPVIAAAVVFDPGGVPKGLDDSKALTAAARARLFDEISAVADVGIGEADVHRIDADNILQATLTAMAAAVRALRRPPCVVLVDGNRAPPLAARSETVVGGDRISASIAAASIIAKVTRDRIMDRLDARFPAYGWARNRGYGTAEHLAALTAHGPTPHHRRSFRPVAEALTGR